MPVKRLCQYIIWVEVMKSGFELTKILITVLTYPHPSQKYQETVCTAGLTESGEWVRLYPVDYRYLPKCQQFKKWQRIEIALAPWGHSSDKRRESREPDLFSIRLLGEPISPKDSWRARSEIIDRLPHHTIQELKELYKSKNISLGIVRPKKILDLKVTTSERDWADKYQSLWSQKRLFGEQKPLRKIPYKFQYVFECEGSDKPHHIMNLDWELGVLFLKECDRLDSEKKAIQSIKDKFLGQMCRDDRDTRFFMGTRHPYNEWLVLGTFWPPKIQPEKTLFDQ